MRRRSDRGKTKETKEESPEKSTRNSHRHSRRRRKSSSSDEETKSPKKSTEPVSQPLEVEVQNIELPQEENLAPVTAKVENDEISKKPPESQKDWKEDNTFWESEPSKPAQEPIEEGSSKEKEESSLWKVQSANGAGGEIQKLKICRQRPTESPEIGETSLRKRLSRGAKDSRSTDDSTHEESEKDTKKSKHRTRTSSRNSPLVSPIVVCDRSEDSPTKIKIINVGHINIPDTKAASEQVTDQTKEASQTRDTLDIALPTDDPPPQANNEERVPEVTCENNSPAAIEVVEEAPKTEECVELTKVEESVQDAAKKSSPTASPKKDNVEINASKSSNRDSDSSEDSSKPRKVKKKRRRELQSTVQRRMSTSADPKQESSDSEDEERKKKEVDRQGSTDTQENQPDLVSDKENEADNSIPAKDVSVGDSHDKEEQTSRPLPRKRRWGSSKANRPEKKPILYISTDSLKNLIPDAKPVPADELQLSVEEEEGQLDDDDEEDEVVALVAKEEEKQMERERQKEERQKREEEERKEERRKRQERVVKSKPEQPPPSSNTSEKGAAPRKILLLTEDAKKLARSPSPPRHKPTSVLYITHLVRPFTVQQLKNLLLRTGTIAENGFWIDKIKSKCYVQYTTEDAAVETRHALHGVRWPTSNPKTLVVEFASHDDLSMALALSEEPEVPRKAEPLTMVEGWVAEQARIKEKGRRAVVREWDVGKPEHPDEALEYDLKMKEKREQERKARKERHHRSATPETEPPARKNRRKEEDAPAKLLDDLFRKTKTSPCIYWLPLTQEQIAVKEEIRRQHMAEHERRMAEMKKAEMSRRERERRNRK